MTIIPPCPRIPSARWPRFPRRRTPPRSPAHWTGRQWPTCAAPWSAWNRLMSAGHPARRGRLLRIRNPGLHAGGAFGLDDAILVLLGAQRARLDHAPAKDLQRIRHRRDLVALAAAMNFRIEIAARQKLHRALQIADPPQDVAADIEPDEQHGSDESEAEIGR